MDLFGSALQSVTATATGFFGGGRSVTIERPCNVFRPDTDAQVLVVQARSEALAGESSLEIEGAVHISGEVPAGVLVTVGGQPYQVASLARFSSGWTTVLLTTALLAPVSIADPVTLAAKATLSYQRMTGRLRYRDFQGGDIRTTDSVLYLSSEVGSLAPVVGDVLLGGQTISKVEPIGDQDNPAGWAIYLGDAVRG